jgi:hypothetical protein
MHLAWGGGFIVGSTRFGVPFRAVAFALGPRRRTAAVAGTERQQED